MDNKTQTGIHLTQKEKEKLKNIAQKNKRSMAGQVRYWIETTQC